MALVRPLKARVKLADRRYSRATLLSTQPALARQRDLDELPLEGAGTEEGAAVDAVLSGASCRLRVVTDFSGMEAPILALSGLGVACEHLCSSDADGRVRDFIRANFAVARIEHDVRSRDLHDIFDVDGYFAGPPCPPFSTAGLRLGADAADGQGLLIWACVKFVQSHRPTFFVLEQVPGFRTAHGGALFRSVLSALTASGTYKVQSQVLNTRDHGLPQNRRRLYIVGLKKTLVRRSFCFPEPVPSLPLTELLDPRSPDDDHRRLPDTGATSQQVVRAELARLAREGVDLKHTDLLLDAGVSLAWSSRATPFSPCLLRGRRHGMWLVSRGRFLSLGEMARLQGIDSPTLRWPHGVPHALQLLGNAMSVNVLQRLLCRIVGSLRDVGLVDPWETGLGQRRIREAARRRTHRALRAPLQLRHTALTTSTGMRGPAVRSRLSGDLCKLPWRLCKSQGYSRVLPAMDDGSLRADGRCCAAAALTSVVTPPARQTVTLSLAHLLPVESPAVPRCDQLLPGLGGTGGDSSGGLDVPAEELPFDAVGYAHRQYEPMTPAERRLRTRRRHALIADEFRPVVAASSLEAAADDNEEEADPAPAAPATAPTLAAPAAAEPATAVSSTLAPTTAAPTAAVPTTAATSTPAQAATAPTPWQLLGRLGRALVVEIGEPSPVTPRSGSDRRRLRGLFPLGLLTAVELTELLPVLDSRDACEALAYTNGIILALNTLYGVKPDADPPARRSLAQRRGLEEITQAAVGLASRLAAAPLPRSGWEVFEDGANQDIATLCADAVDVPQQAGTCDPLKVVSANVAAKLSSVETVFPAPPPGLDHFSGFYAGPRTEYVQLCVRQLRAGMLSLARTCRGGGTVFPVAKSDNRQRVVWHGTRCSKGAAVPPKPRHLANPSVFGFLELREGRLLRVSKRDCKTWFDQLVLPAALSRFMARPRVSVAELLEAGLTHGELELALCTGEQPVVSGTWLHPLARNWPMGFSWSSFTAQETLLSIAELAGLTSRQVLAEDAPLPDSLELAFAVATDDAMLFSDAGPGATLEPTQRLVRALEDHGAVLNPKKDIDDELNTTCVGIDLVEGREWWPPGVRLASLFSGVLGLAQSRRASPAAVAGYLGVTQWFCLLRRARLSVFDRVYGFCSGARARDRAVRDVPAGVVRELLLDAVLAAFGSVDLQRPHLSFVGATDASTVFGHGAAVAPLSPDALRSVARLSCKAGDHVTLVEGPELAEELSARLGPRHALDLDLADFEVVLCVRVADPLHINLEEARALIRYVQWILRSRQRFGHRVVVLVDSKVVIGAVTKGRSSSPALNTLLRRLAALCFAGGLVLHCVFVPTSHNPSDWPSRGGPETWPADLFRGRRARRTAQRRAAPKPLSAAERLEERTNAAWNRLKACGMIGTDSDSSDSDAGWRGTFAMALLHTRLTGSAGLNVFH